MPMPPGAAGPWRISRIPVPSGCSAGSTARQRRSCSESSAAAQPARHSRAKPSKARHNDMPHDSRMRSDLPRSATADPPTLLRRNALAPIFPQVTGGSRMSESEPRRGGFDFDLKPHSYDPVTQPELFEGVMARRVLAFIIDLFVITVPLIFLAIFIFIFGIVTLGFGWLLFFLFSPITVIWAILYRSEERR